MSDLCITCVALESRAALSGHEEEALEKVIQRALGEVEPLRPQILLQNPGMCLIGVAEAAHADRLANELLRHASLKEVGLAVCVGIAAGRENPVERSFEAQSLAGIAARNQIVIGQSAFQALSPFEQDLYGAEEKQHPLVYRTRFASGLKRCFVVSAIGHGSSQIRGRADQVFDLYLKRACAEKGFQPIRSDQEFTPAVRQSLMASISSAELVIAYLGRAPWNPNVMLEVGYRLATGGPLVLLRDSHEDGSGAGELPFDLGDMQVLELPSSARAESPDAVRSASAAIAKAITIALEKTPSRWNSDHAIAVIDIDTHAPAQHIIQEVTDEAQRLFGRTEGVVGEQVGQVIQELGAMMPVGQFNAFGNDQNLLLAQLVGAGGLPFELENGSIQSVRAKVPMVFQNHPDKNYDRRAFLPIIVNHRRNTNEGKLSLTVLYLDVTSVTRVAPDGTFECRLVPPEGTGRLIWDSYAVSYDRILSQLSFYSDAVDRHERALSQAGATAVLDLGAGTGNLTRRLLASGMRVTAVDHSRAMLDRLQEKVLALDDPYVLILERSAEDLQPLRDGQFEAVTILLALFAMERPQRALLEAIRVLAPGGTLVITEPKATFSLDPLIERAEADLRSRGLFEELRADWDRVLSVNERIDPAVHRVLPAERIADILRARGFEEIREQESHLGQCTTITARRAR